MSQASQTCDGSEKPNLLGVVDATPPTTQTTNESIPINDQDSPERDPPNISLLPYVVKTPRADSKLILQNMEEVLNSVKRKHKQKHRRKKELKKIALQEAEAAAAAENEANADESTKVSPKSPKHPLQESKKNVDDVGSGGGGGACGGGGVNGGTAASELKSPMKNATILDHFARTPKKRYMAEREAAKDEKPTDTPKEAAPPKVANAFEVMMNARNKTIGSNTPGKDPATTSPVETPDNCNKIVHIKRKILLQEWADKKGGVKRRLEEEATEAYIETAMQQRAKRFKAMLTNGHDTKSEEKPSAPASVDKSTKATPEVKSSSKHSQPQKSRAGRKLKRNSKYARRLSSADSMESIENASQDSSAGFLAKLSSPIKKRDSLLGYFPKKPSPSVEGAAREVQAKVLPTVQTIVASENITPKRGKGRPPKKDKLNTPVAVVQVQKERQKQIEVESKAIEQSIETPESSSSSRASRPKRQCSRKSRYDQDLSPISTKPEEPPNHEKKKPPPKPEDPEIIDLDYDDSPTKQTPKKLAPLFIKSVPKPSIDPETLRAKHEFLMSGVPEKMRLEMEKQKQFQQYYEEVVADFPTVSHVEQLTPEKNTTPPNRKKVACAFKLRPFIDEDDDSQKTPTRKSKKRIIGTFTTCTQKDFRNVVARNMAVGPSPLTQVENKRQIIKEWKVEYDKFPTFRCYNQLREKYRHFCAIDAEQEAEQFTDSFVVTRSSTRRSLQKEKFDPNAEEEKPPPSAPNGELLFTEKYKATSSDQVLVNVAPVNQLKEFLSSWRGHNRANDSNAFVDMNDSSNSNCTSSNSVVLLGPNSSGKTNAVFALANEMNFAVLEVNAGMKRTGKKILQELQEATQSHQVRKNAKSSAAATKKNLLKTSLNNGNKKQRRPSGDDSNEQHQKPPPSIVDEIDSQTRKSLILIEDADVIFEQHDAGFVDALYTLASTSKRPVIIMATNPNCQHLQRLINQNTINFAPPNVLNISKFLSVLSLIENCPVELNDLVSLYLLNRKHLRKTILEMQFYIQSGGDRLAAIRNPYDEKGNTSSSAFFASPTKRRFSEETETVTEMGSDEWIEKNKKKLQPAGGVEITYHTGLFDFYTLCQNTKCRIPYPVDFDLLRTNLTAIFKVSRNLVESTSSSSLSSGSSSTRRKSRSPKKAWLSALQRTSVSRALSDFYENLSTAVMMAGVQECEDRLTNNVSEEMAHCLVERAIEKNLAARHYAYNLFDSPRDGITLTSFSPVTPLRSSRSMALDYEPSLRSICRSEQNRANNERRRGTRFYHYLRNSCVNLGSFSLDNFENACDILHDPSDIEVILSQTTSSSQKSL